MSMDEKNVKMSVLHDTKHIMCKCGGIKQESYGYIDDDEEYEWVEIRCVKCHRTLFYNGA